MADDDSNTPTTSKKNKKPELRIVYPTYEPLVFDTSPDYYRKREEAIVTEEFYDEFPNDTIWRRDKPRPPRLLGVDRRHLDCFINKDDEHDYLNKYLEYKEEKRRLEEEAAEELANPQKKKNKKKKPAQ